jgi:hypothetical protein
MRHARAGSLRLPVILVGLLCAFVAACGGGGGGSSPVLPAPSDRNTDAQVLLISPSATTVPLPAILDVTGTLGLPASNAAANYTVNLTTTGSTPQSYPALGRGTPI